MLLLFLLLLFCRESSGKYVDGDDDGEDEEDDNEDGEDAADLKKKNDKDGKKKKKKKKKKNDVSSGDDDSSSESDVSAKLQKGRNSKRGSKAARQDAHMSEIANNRWNRRRHLPRLVNVIAENKEVFLARNRKLTKDEKDTKSTE